MQSPPFFHFFKKHGCMQPEAVEALGLSPASHRAGAPPARLALYSDEVVPGNIRRPDDARGYTAVYWTCLDFPDWYLSSPNGWFPFAFVPKVLRNYPTLPQGASQPPLLPITDSSLPIVLHNDRYFFYTYCVLT